MTKTFCDRDGALIASGGFVITWFNGTATITSDLCPACHEELVAWFGNGKPVLEAVQISVSDLQTARGVMQTEPSK